MSASPAIPEVPAIPADNRILFFGRDKKSFGFLSHFHPAPFVVDGEAWSTIEHFYQSRKSLDPAYRLAIRACETPGQAKKMGTPRKPGKMDRGAWFDGEARAPRADWEAVKLDVMREAELAKYGQNPDLLALLLATGDAEIVEDSPNDFFWGCGRDSSGANWAGRILMETRAKLRGR